MPCPFSANARAVNRTLQRGMRRAQKPETAEEAAAAGTHALLNLMSLADMMAEKGRTPDYYLRYVIKRQPLDNDKTGIVLQGQSENTRSPLNRDLDNCNVLTLTIDGQYATVRHAS
jgi:hypothetical protein